MLNSFEELQEYVAKLKEKLLLPTNVESIQERVLYAYVTKVFDQLTQIVEPSQSVDENQRIDNLNNFLRDNWDLVNGTPLSYTALADHELTKLLCDITQFVVQEKNKRIAPGSQPLDAVTTLMPTISTDSLREDIYPPLGSEFDYTTKKWVTHDVDMSKLLKTHILGREGKYLIPVRLISEMELSTTDQKFDNVYFDYTNHSEGMISLDDGEIKRLFEHSEPTFRTYFHE